MYVLGDRHIYCYTYLNLHWLCRVGIDQDEKVDAVLLGALDKIEKQLGRTLKTSDQQGLEQYDAELDEEFAK
jgi:hypothetical protein